MVTLSRPFKALARRTFRLLLPSDTTPRLSSVVSLFSSVMPPTTFTCSFSFFLMTFPISPPYFMPSFRVATSSLVPSGFSYTIRVVVVPGAPSTPGLPSRVTEMFVVTPSFPLMPIFPSLPFSPVATMVSTFRFLFIFTSIVVFPAGSCVIKVLRFSPLYSVSAAVPSPFTVILEPSLLVFVPPALASNCRPLAITSSNLDLDAMSFNFTVSVLSV